MTTSTIARSGGIRHASAVRTGDDRGVPVRSAHSRPLVAEPSGSRSRLAGRAEWRRPAGVPSSRRGTGARVSSAVHERSRSQAASNAWMVAIFAAVLFVVGGAAILVRGIGVVDTTTSVAVVEVQAGDTIGSIAAHNAPGLSVGAVVGQIRSMNGMAGGQLEVGQTLRVPVTAGR